MIMLKKSLTVLGLLGFLLLAVSACQQTKPESLEATATNLWVSGYYVGYLDYPVSEIDFSGITHLMIGPILPKADATLEVTLYAPDGPHLARQAVQAAHAKGKKAIAFLGGQDSSLAFAGASSSTNRAKFITNLKKLVTDYSFDGLDIDWEPVSASDKPLALALIKDLRKALPTAILTFPAGAGFNTNFPEDLSFYAQLEPYLNQLNLMTYGLVGGYADGTPYEGWLSWHSSPLYNPKRGEYWRTPSSVDDAVLAYLAAGVPAKKLGIGIGFYGGCWTGPVTGPRQEPNGSRFAAGDNDMSYSNIQRDYYVASALKWDAAARVPYLSFSQPKGPKGCTFISYENPNSISQKGSYVKAKGLGGTILWNINEGYVASRVAGQRNPLLVATRKAFLE
jgi:chitinase